MDESVTGSNGEEKTRVGERAGLRAIAGGKSKIKVINTLLEPPHFGPFVAPEPTAPVREAFNRMIEAGRKGLPNAVYELQRPRYIPHYDAIITPHFNRRNEYRGTVIELLHDAAQISHWSDPALVSYVFKKAIECNPLIQGKAHVMIFATMRGNDLDTLDPVTDISPLTRVLGIQDGYHLQLSLKEFSMKVISAMQTQKDKVCGLHRKIFDNPLSSHIFIQPYQNVESLLRETQIQIAQSACAELELIG